MSGYHPRCWGKKCICHSCAGRNLAPPVRFRDKPGMTKTSRIPRSLISVTKIKSSIRFRWYLSGTQSSALRAPPLQRRLSQKHTVYFLLCVFFMSDLVPRKERHLWYWLQGITIFISLVAVFASFFAGIMAYKASVNSAEVSWRLNKKNEIESRLYQQKYDLYKDLIEKLSPTLDYQMMKDNKLTLDDGFLEASDKILQILKETWPSVRILWSANLVNAYNCVYWNIFDFETNLALTEPKKWKDWILIFQRKVNWFFENVLWWVWLLESAMREDLWMNQLPPIYAYNSTGWNPEWTWSWNPIPDCSRQRKDMNLRFYIKNN